MIKEVFERNRQRLMEKLSDNSAVILFAGNAPRKSADEKYQFTPNRNFYYFTGINEEEHIIFLSKIGGTVTEKLFIKDIDEDMEKWVGKSIRPNEGKDISGINDVAFISTFESFLNKTFNNLVDINLYLDIDREDFNSLNNLVSEFANDIKRKYPFVNIKNIKPLIAPLRLVKSKEEIAELQKAIDVTIEGVNTLMNNCKSGMKEYELEAYFDFVCKSNGIKDFAFKTIAAAGKNATILHYVDNNCVIKDGDLILFDLGAQYNYYNGDISRTFPVSGKFSERQKAVYNAVLRVNEKVINEIKPGVRFLDLNEKAKEWVAEECISLGLIKDKVDVSKYYWHSIGHSLGLDTHDIEENNRNTVFKEGMVWTVEPGIYIAEEGIGVRIEDDVLVTANGFDVLTKNMIKTVEEIEEFMNK